MSSVVGFFRRLLGWEEDEARSTYPSVYEGRLLFGQKNHNPPRHYDYNSESQKSSVQTPAQPLSGHNVPTRYEYSQKTTSGTSSRSQTIVFDTSSQSQTTTPGTSSQSPDLGSLFGQKNHNPPCHYDYHSESQKSSVQMPAQPLSGHNVPTRYEHSQKTTSGTSSRSQTIVFDTSSQSQTNTSGTSSQSPGLGSLFGQKNHNPPRHYDYHSESQKSSVQTPAQPLSGHNVPTRYEYSQKTTSGTSSRSQTIVFDTSSQSQTTTSGTTSRPPSLGSQSNIQTTSTKPNKSSETIQKPKVLSPTTLQPDSSSPKPHCYSSKPILSEAPFNPTIDQKKTSYIWVEKGTTALTYKVPEDVEALIKKDILPKALKKPLSPSTYKDFFHTMLYAEDWYIEKWNGFEMENVSLEVEDAAIYRKKKDKNLNKTNLEEEDDKVFVAFEMDSVPQNRPFLLSRDFASVRPSGSGDEPFQGIIYRVVKSNRVLVEFGEDFHSQHYQGCKYDVKFSFNRVCLKRAHQAIDSVSDSLFKNFLFPTRDCSSKVNMLPSQSSYMDGKLDTKQIVALHQICGHHAPPPFLVEGPLCITESRLRSKWTGMFETKELSRTGTLIREAILCTYRTKPDARVLICAPTNATCDELVKSLRKEIPESDMFRANAAFREKDEVLLDILPSCRISGECFSCPSLKELEKFKVVSSTYMSCFRLHNEGLLRGHFSHMFMLDASSTTEPEALVALAYFAHESTGVVVTGAGGNSSRWVRSTVARRNGLMKSYFERLCESKSYEDVCHL